MLEHQKEHYLVDLLESLKVDYLVEMVMMKVDLMENLMVNLMAEK
jgi:hypothetical protein